ncbi:hypothetical protein VK792_11330 [Mesobacterium sp. TK19101]|uniref:DUF4153 domain-containing protein n=1 Tax=Mesobacterium hydrothermale TaxID=3111907 RepID=A0ABU6HHI6_9RHOB|nr:hypothetical protein [Mesobacterium sp. TK19101]MEC3861877.1 hypothetical protein [Mesobacterium sp. TK19101]
MTDARFRLLMLLVGGIAGLACWALFDLSPDVLERGRMWLFLSALAFSFFTAVLALSGPSPMQKTLLPSLGLGAGIGLLLVWASGRHAKVGQFLDVGYGPLAVVTLILIAVPFLGAGLQGKWRDYGTLFDLTWTIMVRYISAALFSGIFWALVMLSDALLKIVGVTIIDDLLDIDAVPYILSGSVLGLAMGVVHELRDYISPFLVLRLLRLLVPPVLVVIVIFVIALPFRGLSGLVGSFSPALTLMSAASAAILLVTVSVDRDAEEAISLRWMQHAVRLLAVLVAVLGGLSITAIFIRVADHGWTPDRLLAMTFAFVIMAYGLIYTYAVLWGRTWMSEIRQANIGMALVTVAVAVAWLTPLFRPEAISTNDHLRLYRNSGGAFVELPLYEMVHDWGVAGKRGLESLEADYPQLSGDIAKAKDASSLWRFRRETDVQNAAPVRADLRQRMPVFPRDADLPDGAFDALGKTTLDPWLQACDRTFDGQPGCALLLQPGPPARAIVLLRQTGNRVTAQALRFTDDRLEQGPELLILPGGTRFNLPEEVLTRTLNGVGVLAPVTVEAWTIGDMVLFSNN